jgi:hypothetical protein
MIKAACRAGQNSAFDSARAWTQTPRLAASAVGPDALVFHFYAGDVVVLAKPHDDNKIKSNQE